MFKRKRYNPIKISFKKEVSVCCRRWMTQCLKTNEDEENKTAKTQS